MRCSGRILAASVLALALASAGVARAHDLTAGPSRLAPGEEPRIEVTVNPEARVSAVMAGVLPPLSCGRPNDLAVNIVNQGYVTAELHAAVVGDVPDGVVVHLQPERLTGRTQEHRRLEITVLDPAPVDVTVAFSARGIGGDLGGRDRVHLLLQCQDADRGR